MCCGYLKEPSQWDGSFEHPKHTFKLMDRSRMAILQKHILKLMDKKIINIFTLKIFLNLIKTIKVNKGAKIRNRYNHVLNPHALKVSGDTYMSWCIFIQDNLQ